MRWEPVCVGYRFLLSLLSLAAVSVVVAACDGAPAVPADGGVLPDGALSDGDADAALPSPRPVAPFFEPERLQVQ